MKTISFCLVFGALLDISSARYIAVSLNRNRRAASGYTWQRGTMGHASSDHGNSHAQTTHVIHTSEPLHTGGMTSSGSRYNQPITATHGQPSTGSYQGGIRSGQHLPSSHQMGHPQTTHVIHTSEPLHTGGMTSSGSRYNKPITVTHGQPSTGSYQGGIRSGQHLPSSQQTGHPQTTHVIHTSEPLHAGGMTSSGVLDQPIQSPQLPSRPFLNQKTSDHVFTSQPVGPRAPSTGQLSSFSSIQNLYQTRLSGGQDKPLNSPVQVSSAKNKNFDEGIAAPPTGDLTSFSSLQTLYRSSTGGDAGASVIPKKTSGLFNAKDVYQQGLAAGQELYRNRKTMPSDQAGYPGQPSAGPEGVQIIADSVYPNGKPPVDPVLPTGAMGPGPSYPDGKPIVVPTSHHGTPLVDPQHSRGSPFPDPSHTHGAPVVDTVITHGTDFVDPTISHGTPFVDPAISHGTPLIDSTLSHGSPFPDPPHSHRTPIIDPTIPDGTPFVDPTVSHGTPFVDPTISQGTPFVDPTISHGTPLIDSTLSHGSPFPDPPHSHRTPIIDPTIPGGTPFLDPTVSHGTPFVDPTISQGTPFVDPTISHGTPFVDPTISHGSPFPDPSHSHDTPIVDITIPHGSPFVDPDITHGTPIMDPPTSHGSPLPDPPHSHGTPIVDITIPQWTPFVDPDITHGTPIMDPPSSHGSPFPVPPHSHGTPIVDPTISNGTPFVDPTISDGNPFVDPTISREAPFVDPSNGLGGPNIDLANGPGVSDPLGDPRLQLPGPSQPGPVFERPGPSFSRSGPNPGERPSSQGQPWTGRAPTRRILPRPSPQAFVETGGPIIENTVGREQLASNPLEPAAGGPRGSQLPGGPGGSTSGTAPLINPVMPSTSEDLLVFENQPDNWVWTGGDVTGQLRNFRPHRTPQ